MKKLPQTPRQKAIAAGARRYNTGKPCVNGHVAPRDTVTGNCDECHRKHAAASVKRQRERIRRAINGGTNAKK